MAETQVTGRQIKDKSVFDLDIDLTQAPVHPTLVSSDRLVIVDPTDGNIKTSTFANLLTGLDALYLRLSGGTVSGNLVVSGTTTLNAVTKVGTAMIPNLNADFLDGQHGSYYSAASHSHNLTDGIFDGNGLLYAPYVNQPSYGATPVTGVFYSVASVPNSVGMLHFTGQLIANSIKSWNLIYGDYVAYIGNSGVLPYSNEVAFYNGSGDQVIAGYCDDLNGEYYYYANSKIQYSSFTNITDINSPVNAVSYHATAAPGTAPFTCQNINLCSNLNADLLDGQHGAYYLDYNNFTNTPAIPVINVNDRRILYMNGTAVAGIQGLEYNQFMADLSLGYLAEASGGNCIAIGSGSIAIADGSVAIGYAADSEGVGSIAIGGNSMVYDNYAIALGIEANPNGINSIAIGRSATTANANDISIGSASYNNKTSIFGIINFPTIVTNGFLKILDGEVYASISGGTGTVTSVGLALPNIFSVTGSPVTTSGTLTASLVSQTKNYVFAAPHAANGVPSFRALVASDIPSLAYDNYYSWTIGVNSASYNVMGTQFGSGYTGVKLLAGTGVTLTDSSSGSLLQVTINASATVSGNEFTMIGRNTTGYGVYSELTPSLIMRLISNNSGSDQCSFFDASGVWSRRDSFVTTGASNVTYTGQTLADITGLAILLGANSTYEYEAMLSVQTSAVTTGIQYAIAYTAGYSQFSGKLSAA
ncbi:MAG: hypothetical protein IPH20_11740 [Bacteroidales bacterium]|nr:hypothetical protein [Bacteroidales bacterium]